MVFRSSCNLPAKKWSAPSIQISFFGSEANPTTVSPIVLAARRHRWEPLTKSFGFTQFAQKTEVVAAAIDGRDRKPRPTNAVTRGSGQAARRPTRGAEGKSRENNGQMEFLFQPIQRGANIVHLAMPVVVLTVAQASSAKVKAQRGIPKTVQRLHGVKYHLVMQRPAEQRMRMANQRGVSGLLRSHVQDSFEPACWAVEKKRAD